jgi:hypothetical protein
MSNILEPQGVPTHVIFLRWRFDSLAGTLRPECTRVAH